MADQLHFELIWTKIESRLLGIATARLGYHDAQDCVYQYSYYVWQSTAADPSRWEDEEHASAYFLKIFRFRVLSYLRQMRSLNQLKQAYAAEHHGRFAELETGWLDVCLLGDVVELGRELRMHLDGYSMAEIAVAVGSSKASVSRRISDKLAELRWLISEELKATSSDRVEAGEYAVDLRRIQDFPDSLEEWIAMCGGPGYCLGGSGQKVLYPRRFRASFNGRLLNTFARVSTPNAKNLADELGMYHLVRWRTKRAKSRRHRR